MAKQLLSLAGGAVILSEDSGVFSLAINATLGGGAAAGIVQGQASLKLDAASALKLGQATLNAALPASVEPLAEVIEGIADQALAALE